MRSSAGIVAGLFLMGLVANCGGDDSSSSNPPTAGTHNSGAGEGGEGATSNKGGSSSAGSSTAGTTMAMAGEGGTAPMAECAKDADCGATAKCVDGACKKNDGESCTASAECQNACIDGTCTAKLDDGMPCTADGQCAHTCIDGACAPVSDVGGDCDADLGAGGAGGAGSGTGGAGGDSGAVAQNPDCKSPLTCVSGKCLTPDGEACTDNVDCINTCVKNVCQPKSTIDGACDDKADCAVAALVCDETNAKCKLDLLQQCTDNGQCKSDNCICSNANCTVRTCKNANANCLCKWSPADSAVCTAQSANLNSAVEDPQGCTGATNQYCNQGQCVANAGGDCVNPCKTTPDDPNTPANESMCVANGAPTGCNPGYHATVTAQCALNKAVCSGSCKCDLN